MLNNINLIRPYCIDDSQDFMWVAEGIKGNLQSEFEIDGSEIYFTEINKNDLLNFGIVGCGHRMFYEIPTGKFNINGDTIEIIYKTDEKEYNLTNNFVLYNDVIQFKECESLFNVARSDDHSTKTTITSYNFGYKVKLNIEDKIFNFKAVCTVPYNESAYINFRLVCSEDIEGKLLIKKNDEIITEFDAPLKENYSGEVNWIVR